MNFRKKIISLCVITVLAATLLFMYIPRNVGNALRFEDDGWISVLIMGMDFFHDGPFPQHIFYSYIFENGTDEFAAIQAALSGYSFRRTFRRRNEATGGTSRRVTSVTISGESGSHLYLINVPGANTRINGAHRRMGVGNAETLVEEILSISTS